MILVKQHNSSYSPAYRSDIDESDKIKVGEEVRATRARNPKFHRLAFSLIKLGFDNQDHYKNADIYRQIISIKAGYVDWVEGKDGVKYPFARSWAFDKMGQKEFEEMFAAILEVISKELNTDDKSILANLENYY